MEPSAGPRRDLTLESFECHDGRLQEARSGGVGGVKGGIMLKDGLESHESRHWLCYNLRKPGSVDFIGKAGRQRIGCNV